MPFTTKRKSQLANARQIKQRRLGGNVGELEQGETGRSAEECRVAVGTRCNLPVAEIKPEPAAASISPGLTAEHESSDCHATQLKPIRFVFTPFSVQPVTQTAYTMPGVTQESSGTVANHNVEIFDISTLDVAVGVPAHELTISAPVPESDSTNPQRHPSQHKPAPSHKCAKTRPPSHLNAENALRKIDKLIRPPRNTGFGYKTCKLNPRTRTQCDAIASCLRFYLRSGVTFTVASREAAVGAGRGIWHARRIRAWVQQFVSTGDLPSNRYGRSKRSLLHNEDISGEIQLFLQRKGKYVVADDIVEFLNDPEVRTRLTLKKTINIRTAQRWLHNMEYRWQLEQSGHYFDGHERDDVVHYCQNSYAPKVKALEPFMQSWDAETGDELPLVLPQGRRQVVMWFHDASTFYAHDRRKLRWVKRGERALLQKKGQGPSSMVADFVCPEYGFLKSQNGRSDARKTLLAGKNREGYMTNDNICQQFRKAVDLVKKEYPDQDHIFVYDNARIHTKRSPTAPSARFMTKGESSNFGATVVNAKGKAVKVPMDNPKFPDGSKQPLYLPNGKFKGMVALLQERGYNTSGLKAECQQGFKCVDTMADCCCRRILFKLIDLQGGQKSILESLAGQLGVEVIFLPKFHCELNPIEQCWGYAKRKYRVEPASSLTADVEKNMIKALKQVPIKSIRKYAARSRRFVDAYAQGLDGPNAAAREWARKRYRGHRSTPDNIIV